LIADDGRPVSTVQDYLRILRRRKWILIPAAVIAPLIAILLTVREPTLYQATAQVLVNRMNLAAVLSDIQDPTQLDSPRLLNTQAQLARVPEVAQRAVEAVGVPGRTGSDLLDASNVSQGTNSDVLTFTVNDENPELAAALATQYAREYVAYRLAIDRRALNRARRSAERRIADLRAAGLTDSSLYGELVEKKDRLVTMASLLTPRAELVRRATPAEQVPTNLVWKALLGLALGILSGIGLAFLFDALDSRVRAAEEVSDRLRLRLLGRLPQPPRRLRWSRRLVMLAEPESPYAEPYRMLRTSLEFVRVRQRDDGAARVARTAYRIMITSAVEREGKSTTIGNLAVALARSGRKVLLIDLDFHQASLHRFFDVAPEPGVMDLVVGSTSLRQAVRSVRDEPSLRILPIGTLRPQARDIALTGGLEQALEQIEKAKPDIVLIDGPPLLRVGDALALTEYVDGLVIVANLKTVRARMLHELSRVLDACPAEKLGLIAIEDDLKGGFDYLAYPYSRGPSVGERLARFRVPQTGSRSAEGKPGP
jgi:polysaccharide biosynthesis transport protein